MPVQPNKLSYRDEYKLFISLQTQHHFLVQKYSETEVLMQLNFF